MLTHARLHNNFAGLIQRMNIPARISDADIAELFTKNDVVNMFTEDMMRSAEAQQPLSELQKKILTLGQRSYRSVQFKLARYAFNPEKSISIERLLVEEGKITYLSIKIHELLLEEAENKPDPVLMREIDCLLQYPMLISTLTHQLFRLKMQQPADKAVGMALIKHRSPDLKDRINRYLYSKLSDIRQEHEGQRIHCQWFLEDPQNTAWLNEFFVSVFNRLARGKKNELLNAPQLPQFRRQFIITCLNKQQDGPLTAFEEAFLAEHPQEVVAELQAREHPLAERLLALEAEMVLLPPQEVPHGQVPPLPNPPVVIAALPEVDEVDQEYVLYNQPR
jgi:hypothetical protein